MESIERRYYAVTRTLETLQKSLKALQDPAQKHMYDFLRDSVIQRFEYSIDTFWKLLKVYLQDQQQVSMEVVTPRAILRESLNAGLLTAAEFELLVDSVKDRNLTSHTYNEKLAEEIVKNIFGYYEVMMSVVKRLSQKGD